MNIITAYEFKRLVKSSKLIKLDNQLVTKDLSGLLPVILDERRIKFTISTPDVDRHGDSILLSAWQNLDHYMRNPVVLWGHDDSLPPIARCIDISKDASGLYAVAEFVPADMPVAGPMAEMAYQMCKAGYLGATSVGFIPHEWEEVESRSPYISEIGMNFINTDLMEFSIVPIPANPYALIVNEDENHKNYRLALNKMKQRHRFIEIEKLRLF